MGILIDLDLDSSHIRRKLNWCR